MAAVPIVISPCVIYDKYGRTTEVAAVMGMASIAGLGVGGGPLPGGPGDPPHIWGGGGIGDYIDAGFPTPQPPFPPGTWPPQRPPHPAHPIVLPPDQVPPEMKPPTTPPPGTVTPVPPPAGQGGWPVTGIVPPEYLIVQYPGVGPVYITPPPHAEPAPTGTARRG